MYIYIAILELLKQSILYYTLTARGLMVAPVSPWVPSLAGDTSAKARGMNTKRERHPSPDTFGERTILLKERSYGPTPTKSGVESIMFDICTPAYSIHFPTSLFS